MHLNYNFIVTLTDYITFISFTTDCHKLYNFLIVIIYHTIKFEIMFMQQPLLKQTDRHKAGRRRKWENILTRDRRRVL
jgi:hypothetical protein